jgi:hypothetical protein
MSRKKTCALEGLRSQNFRLSLRKRKVDLLVWAKLEKQEGK